MAIRFWVSCAWRGSQRRVFYVITANHLFYMKRIASRSVEKGKGIFLVLQKKKQIQRLVFKCNHLSIFFL